ncbi:hypothetical protein P2318_32675 [Myxococcaceae bacterium GXIMD 01537]
MALSRQGWGRRGRACAWLAFALLGCTPSKTESAETVVRGFFTALPSEDCAVLGPMLATGGGAKPCPETVRDINAHGYSLVDIVESRVDGRDPDAVLVRARLAQGGVTREAPLVLRVERQAGGWKLRW